jgi:hypothetical protein
VGVLGVGSREIGDKAKELEDDEVMDGVVSRQKV